MAQSQWKSELDLTIFRYGVEEPTGRFGENRKQLSWFKNGAPVANAFSCILVVENQSHFRYENAVNFALCYRNTQRKIANRHTPERELSQWFRYKFLSSGAF